MSMKAAIKCNQVIYNLFQESMQYSYGTHKMIQKIPLMYVMNDDYTTYRHYNKVAYHYHQMVHQEYIGKTRAYCTKAIQHLMNRFQSACPIPVIFGKSVKDYLVDMSLDAQKTRAFNIPTRVFDYMIASNVNRLYDYIHPKAIVCTITGHRPSKHDLWGTQKIHFQTKEPTVRIQPYILEPINNSANMTKVLNIPKPLSGAERQYMIRLSNFLINDMHRAKESLIRLPVVTKAEYNTARKMFKPTIILPNYPSYWIKKESNI